MKSIPDDAKEVRSCTTDTIEAKFPHLHFWSDDTRSYSRCTATYDYIQMCNRLQYEQEHDL